MPVSSALTIAGQLASPERRVASAKALAGALGAEELLVFLRDPEVDALVSAPGFPQTVPGGPTWRTLFREAYRPGSFETSIAYPDLVSRKSATVWVTNEGLVLVLLGGAPKLPSAEELGLPLLAAVFRAEWMVVASQGRLSAEREAARHATTLAAALDKARRELETVLAESARLNEALKVADEERARLLTSERDANRAKDEFLAMLGHELRNPLAPISTALQLIEMRGTDANPKEHAIIRRQVIHLTRLVDDLLDISRITRGKVTLEKTRIELSQVIAKAVEMAGPLIAEHRHRFLTEVDGGSLPVDADEGRLAQVLSNLLNNAARYTPAGGQITLVARREGDQVVVRVRDNGIGIEPGMAAHIFEMFAQGPRAKDRAEGGLGLGLAIVKNLVALHGGQVTVRSDGNGRGSEFVVALPVASSVRLPDSAPTESPKPLAAERNRLRVMVVDDNRDAAELLAEALDHQGYDVRFCHDGLAALQLAEDFEPQVAILDIGLPAIDGAELARRLRKRQRAPLTLIAATGYGQSADRALTREAGFDHHLVKPLDIATVVQLLKPPQ